MEVYEILWKKVLEELEKTTAPLAYETFITRLTPVDINGTKLVLSIQTETLANTIASKFLDKIKDAISKAKKNIETGVLFNHQRQVQIRTISHLPPASFRIQQIHIFLFYLSAL